MHRSTRRLLHHVTNYNNNANSSSVSRLIRKGFPIPASSEDAAAADSRHLAPITSVAPNNARSTINSTSTSDANQNVKDPFFMKQDFAWEQIQERAKAILLEKHYEPLPTTTTTEATAADNAGIDAASMRPITLPQEDQKFYEANAQKIWDKYYRAHRQNSYPMKNYIFKEFPQLDGAVSTATATTTGTITVLECGSGTGSCLFPIVQRNPLWKYYAFDFSHKAIELLTEHEVYKSHDVKGFVWDIATQELPTTTTTSASDDGSGGGVPLIPDNSIDYALMVFMLSAVSPSQMQSVIQRVTRLLRPGGQILFRDYGLYDLAQLRFPRGRQLEENFFVRGDGTRCFYFSKEYTKQLFESVTCATSSSNNDNDNNDSEHQQQQQQGAARDEGGALVTRELEYHTNSILNRREGMVYNRVFIHGVFEKKK